MNNKKLLSVLKKLLRIIYLVMRRQTKIQDQSVEYSEEICADVLPDVPGDAGNENISYFLYVTIYNIYRFILLLLLNITLGKCHTLFGIIPIIY